MTMDGISTKGTKLMAFRMLHLKVYWTAVQHGPIHDESALWRQQNIAFLLLALGQALGSKAPQLHECGLKIKISKVKSLKDRG